MDQSNLRKKTIVEHLNINEARRMWNDAEQCFTELTEESPRKPLPLPHKNITLFKKIKI